MWTVFNHWVEKARQYDDPSSITRLGVDETSTKKGHNYVTIGVDLDNSRVIHVTEGKGKSTLEDIRQHLENKGVKHDQVKQISMDLSPAFIAGSIASFPSAEITFDRFHVVKLLNVAMDKVRKSERLEHDGLKGQKVTVQTPSGIAGRAGRGNPWRAAAMTVPRNCHEDVLRRRQVSMTLARRA